MKIVQIAVSSASSEDTTDVLFVLCEDGTVWLKGIFKGAEWKQVKTPQDSTINPSTP